MRRFREVLSVAGLLIAVVGLARDDRRLIWVAIAMLGASLAIRAVLTSRDRRAARRNAPPGPED